MEYIFKKWRDSTSSITTLDISSNGLGDSGKKKRKKRKKKEDKDEERKEKFFYLRFFFSKNFFPYQKPRISFSFLLVLCSFLSCSLSFPFLSFPFVSLLFLVHFSPGAVFLCYSLCFFLFSFL